MIIKDSLLSTKESFKESLIIKDSLLSTIDMWQCVTVTILIHDNMLKGYAILTNNLQLYQKILVVNVPVDGGGYAGFTSTLSL